MNRHGRILRPHGLALIAQQKDAGSGKDPGRFFGDGTVSGNQNAPGIAGAAQNCGGIGGGYVAFKAGHMAVAHKNFQRKLLHRLSLREKMEGGIHMGAVVGAHGEGGEVI